MIFFWIKLSDKARHAGQIRLAADKADMGMGAHHAQ